MAKKKAAERPLTATEQAIREREARTRDARKGKVETEKDEKVSE